MDVLANRRDIVVGVDGSRNAASAVLWGAYIAHRARLPLRLVFATEHLGGLRPFSNSTDAQWGDDLSSRAGELVEATAQTARTTYPEVTVHTHVIESAGAGETLVGASERAHLLVVGRAGRGSIGFALTGSVASFVADHAQSPVLVCPHVEPRESDPGPIVVGVDGSALSESAVEEAFSFAALFDAPVVAVHAWSSVLAAGAFKIPIMLDWNAVRANESALLSEGIAGFADKYPDVHVEQVLREGSPAGSILEVARSAQMIVVGSRGHNGLLGALAGSTSRNLMHHAPVPVLICRPRRD